MTTSKGDRNFYLEEYTIFNHTTNKNITFVITSELTKHNKALH